MGWIDVTGFPDPPGTEFIPDCQAPWPESVQGIHCIDCATCYHGKGWNRFIPWEAECPHRCEPPICHPDQSCERNPRA